jgi:hypothetical protein
MAVTYGFYNSLNNDRKYDAKQLSSMFDGIITDGIFKGVGGRLMVEASSGMLVNVTPGRAWFNQTWTLNDSNLPLTLDPSDPILNRIDSIIVEVDTRVSVRANTIKIKKGTAATVPVAPALTNAGGLSQYALCTIYIGKNVSSILQANITNLVGTVSCPYVTLIDAQNEIGNRIYTQDNYVTDNQTITESIDALDINLKSRFDAADSAIATLNTNKQATITGAATTVTTNNLAVDKVLISNALGKIAAASISANELGFLAGVTSNLQTQLNALAASNSFTANRAIISNSSGALAVSTVTSTELGYLAGATSNLQSQINALSGGMILTANRALMTSGTGAITASTVTSTELGYLSGVTSALQTQLNGKQATITGAATTIVSSNLTASRALVSDASGKVAAAAATTLAEIGYLNGVTSAIQTQLNNKLGSTAQAADSAKVGGRTIYYATTEPTGAVNGDIWFKPAA